MCALYRNRFFLANGGVFGDGVAPHPFDEDGARLGFDVERLVVANRNGVHLNLQGEAVFASGVVAGEYGGGVGAGSGSKLLSIYKPRVARVEVKAYGDGRTNGRGFEFANGVGEVERGGHVVALTNNDFVRPERVGTVAMAGAVVGTYHHADGVAVNRLGGE